MDPKVKNLFDEYEQAFSDLDVNKQASFFADQFISAGPKGSIASNKHEFLKMANKAGEFYKSVGQESVKILSIGESTISDEYSLVKIHWGAKFQKTGNKLIEFDVSYLVQKTAHEPQIILFIVHQEEEAAMKELGLIAA